MQPAQRSHATSHPTLALSIEAISTISDHELLSGVTKLMGSHRELTAKLVAHLAEIEERRLHLQAGFSSMFDFCVKKLRLGEGEAFRRILAARLGRRFPIVYSLLASGAVHLSALELLRERLTEGNHAELLEAASGKSKREVAELLARRFPRPDVPSRIRKLCIEPLSEARYRVEFTASAELREKLELCRDLMSHANPSRDLGVVVERAVDSLLADLQRKRLARTRRPRRNVTAHGVTAELAPREPGSQELDDKLSASSAKSARVSNAARRQVFERDGLRCTYVAANGRRCEARAFLELDHAEPRALGGGNEPENLRVRCRAHNQLWAEQAYGRERVESVRHFCRQKRRRKRGETCRGSRGEHHERTRVEREPRPAEAVFRTSEGTRGVLERVRLALVGLGFRDADARRAIAEVERTHDEAEPPAIEQALREALLAATANAAEHREARRDVATYGSRSETSSASDFTSSSFVR